MKLSIDDKLNILLAWNLVILTILIYSKIIK